MSTSLLEHFSSLPDVRADRNKLYPLPEILLLVVCALRLAKKRRKAAWDGDYRAKIIFG